MELGTLKKIIIKKLPLISGDCYNEVWQRQEDGTYKAISSKCVKPKVEGHVKLIFKIYEGRVSRGVRAS